MQEVHILTSPVSSQGVI